MPPQTFRFALSGYITVEAEEVKRAMIGMGIRQFPGDPVVTDDDQFRVKHQMASSVDAIPVNQLLQSYLVNGFLVPYDQVLINSVQADMPGAVVSFNGIE